jgi:hypothetical protein
MRSLLVLLFLCSASSAAFSAEDKQMQFGVQSSFNSYRIDDPAGSTAVGSGLSLSGIALVDVGRDNRMMFNLNRDSYSLAGTNTNIGQDVSSIGGGLSYQKLLRITRTWKPWVGAGFGYTSTTYKNRFSYTTPAMQYKYLYADRKATDIEFLLNTNSEWTFNRDWDIGMQAQFAKSLSDKSGSFRVGIYFVY